MVMADFERRKKRKACRSFCERACLAQRGEEQSRGALRVPRPRRERLEALLSQKPAPVGVSESRHSGRGRAPRKGSPPGPGGLLTEERTAYSPPLGEHRTASPAAPSLTHALSRPRLPLPLGAGRFGYEQGLWGSFRGLGLNPSFGAESI